MRLIEPIDLTAAVVIAYGRGAPVTQIQTRMTPLFLALRDASATEPEVAGLWQEIGDRRPANMRLLVADLATTGQLHVDLSHEEAADTIWATNSPVLRHAHFRASLDAGPFQRMARRHMAPRPARGPDRLTAISKPPLPS